MSPRAAWRLEAFGYETSDYVAGKMDWLSFGLPWEGEAVIAGDAVTRDVPELTPGDSLDAARERLEGSDLRRLPVLNPDGVLVGSADRDALSGDGETVDDVLREGPTTVRPSEGLEELLHRMEHARVGAIFVTSSDGRFIGVLERERGTRTLDERS